MTVLVIGGAGYIGSHITKQLLNQNYQVVILDNLSTGHKEAIDPRAIFVEGNLGNSEDLVKVFSTYPIDGVMHFAANSLVGESMVDPFKYYQNNVSSTITLLNSMLEFGVKNFIFSSTAAVYGIPSVSLIDEEQLTQPINPYGHSKLMVEQILKDFSNAYGLNYITLRYFNASGADESGNIGEDHSPETHLIPLILGHLLGERENITVFGEDYETEDGSCVRDYVHVNDLAEAHILALKALLHEELKNEVFNLGNGQGYSVKEVIHTCERVTGIKANINIGERRPGDPAYLVATSNKIASTLGWKAKYPLEEIVRTAWNWHLKNPNGFK